MLWDFIVSQDFHFLMKHIYSTKFPMTYQDSVKAQTFSSLYVADTILEEQLKEQEYRW